MKCVLDYYKKSFKEVQPSLLKTILFIKVLPSEKQMRVQPIGCELLSFEEDVCTPVRSGRYKMEGMKF